MNKTRQILMILFLCGILLAGIGVGVTFAEFESLSYGGKKVIGQENTEQDTIKYELPIGRGDGKINLFFSCLSDKITFEEDKDLPFGTIELDLTYSDYIEPHIMYEENDGQDNKDVKGFLYVGHYNVKDGVEFFFENKEQMLKDLKEGKISTYDVADWASIVVKLHPDTMKYIKYNE